MKGTKDRSEFDRMSAFARPQPTDARSRRPYSVSSVCGVIVRHDEKDAVLRVWG